MLSTYAGPERLRLTRRSRTVALTDTSRDYETAGRTDSHILEHWGARQLDYLSRVQASEESRAA